MKKHRLVFFDKIASDIEHISNDMAEQQSSSAGGQYKKKKADNKSTGLTGHNSGLSGPTGLSGLRTGLTGAPNKSGNSSKAENKARPIFEELLAKFEKEGVIQKKKGWLEGRGTEVERRKTCSDTAKGV